IFHLMTIWVWQSQKKFLTKHINFFPKEKYFVTEQQAQGFCPETRNCTKKQKSFWQVFIIRKLLWCLIRVLMLTEVFLVRLQTEIRLFCMTNILTLQYEMELNYLMQKPISFRITI